MEILTEEQPAALRGGLIHLAIARTLGHYPLRMPIRSHTVQNPVSAATWWLHETGKKKPHYQIDRGVSFTLAGFSDGWDWIEKPAPARTSAHSQQRRSSWVHAWVHQTSKAHLTGASRHDASYTFSCDCAAPRQGSRAIQPRNPKPTPNHTGLGSSRLGYPRIYGTLWSSCGHDQSKTTSRDGKCHINI